MAIEKLKRHKSLSIYQIPAELIKARGWNNSLCNPLTYLFYLE